MSSPVPEDGLTPDEAYQADYVIRGAEATTHLAQAAALGGAFLVYREYMRRRLSERLRGVEGTDTETLLQETRNAYASFVPTWIQMAGPVLTQAYLAGAAETMFQIDNPYLQELAENYAYSLGIYLNEASADAIARGYAAQVNRKVAPKVALANVVDAFGVTNRTMKTLTVILSQKEDAKLSEVLLPSVKKLRAKRAVSAAIEARAETMGEQETWSAREQGKQITWLYAQRRGLIPMNATRQWLTADDERVCPVCGPLHEMEIPISERFEVAGAKYWSPPTHPNCRCTVKLKSHLVSDVAGKVYYADFQRHYLEPDDVAKSAMTQAAPQDDNPHDNDWETQPRARDGRFGTRAHQAEPVIRTGVSGIPTIRTGARREQAPPVIRTGVAPPALKTGVGVPAIRTQAVTAPPALKTQVEVAPPALKTGVPEAKVEEPKAETAVVEPEVEKPAVQAVYTPSDDEAEIEMDLFRLPTPVYGILTSYELEEGGIGDTYFTDDIDELRRHAESWVNNEIDQFITYQLDESDELPTFKTEDGLEFKADHQTYYSAFEYLTHKRNYEYDQLYGDGDLGNVMPPSESETVRVDVKDSITGAWGTADVSLKEFIRNSDLEDDFDQMTPKIARLDVIDQNRTSDHESNRDNKSSLMTYGRYDMSVSQDPVFDQWGALPYETYSIEPLPHTQRDELEWRDL